MRPFVRTWRCPRRVAAHLRDHHDRIVIITDEQTRPGWLPSNTGGYRGRLDTLIDGLVPKETPMCMWNFAGYACGSAPSGQGNCHPLGGLSDGTFAMIPLLEAGRDASWHWEISSTPDPRLLAGGGHVLPGGPDYSHSLAVWHPASVSTPNAYPTPPMIQLEGGLSLSASDVNGTLVLRVMCALEEVAHGDSGTVTYRVGDGLVHHTSDLWTRVAVDQLSAPGWVQHRRVENLDVDAQPYRCRRCRSAQDWAIEWIVGEERATAAIECRTCWNRDMSQVAQGIVEQLAVRSAYARGQKPPQDSDPMAKLRELIRQDDAASDPGSENPDGLLPGKW